jgi:hypothetical protein
MKTFARVLLGTSHSPGAPGLPNPPRSNFAKSVVSERGSQTFATVSYPDKNRRVSARALLIRQSNRGPGFWRDNKKHRTRRVHQIPEDQERPAHWQPRAAR